ncbi:hypothetical protein PMI14_05841 [Acidovorax sp. CF316]|uniref:hypothetical protein n=1 Tax=Acidovorax sp. CF316 TaxID=1144317 RepID=UPI00026BC801|nr:hypothetical protein [Acidovorax sp. CF316]EJE49598.1 hypothetical protein PMI14_05841 [Acidovorax sp. CF316]
MHTSAQKSPLPPGFSLFGDDEDEGHITSAAPAGVPAAAALDPAHWLVCTGTLTRNAEVRVKPVGSEGDAAPVVCIDLDQVTPTAQAVHVEQVFTNATRAKAEAFASHLKKGMRITVHCPRPAVRMSFNDAQHIEVQPPHLIDHQ